MKTELENYLNFVDEFLNKDYRFLLAVEHGKKDKSAKTLSFSRVIEYTNNSLDFYVYFSFESKRIDNNFIRGLEEGVLNLMASGYRVDYFNAFK